MGREHASDINRKSVAPKLKMQSRPVRAKSVAIFVPRKIDESGNQRVGIIPVARRIDGPTSHIGHLMYAFFEYVFVVVVVLVSFESTVSNKAVGPGKKSSFGANLTGGGSHGVAFVQEMMRCLVGRCGKVSLWFVGLWILRFVEWIFGRIIDAIVDGGRITEAIF